MRKSASPKPRSFKKFGGFPLQLLASFFFALFLSAARVVVVPSTLPPAWLFDRQASGFEARLAAFEKLVDERRKQARIPGAALAVVKGGNILTLKGFGFRNLKRRLSVSTDTLFEIGSTTKAMTAMAAMISVDEGKLSLDDAPRKYLPYFRLQDPEADASVTIRDLLCHRTGLGAHDEIWIRNGAIGREALIQAILRTPPTARLREQYQYNNVMYTAAGECVARSQHMTWEDFVSSRIFKPLKMNDTVPSIRWLKDRSNFSIGYKLVRKRPQRAKGPELTSIGPAGSVISNAKDMAKWLRLMAGGGAVDQTRLVSRKGYEELLSSQLKISDDADLGLGWGILQWNGQKLISASGSTFGFSSHIEFLPNQTLGYVLLCNAPVDDSRLFAQQISQSFWKSFAPTP